MGFVNGVSSEAHPLASDCHKQPHRSETGLYYFLFLRSKRKSRLSGGRKAKRIPSKIQQARIGMQIERLKPADVWDSTPYKFTQAVCVRQCQNLVFVAGQTGMDEHGEIVQGLESQIRQSFENLRRIVTGAGGTMANVIRITGYLRDMSGLETYTKVVSEVFGDKLPAATLLEVKALALEPLLVEVDAIAAL